MPPAPFSTSLHPPSEVWVSRSQTLNNLFLKCYGFNWRSEFSHLMYLSFQTMFPRCLDLPHPCWVIWGNGKGLLKVCGCHGQRWSWFSASQATRLCDYTNTLLMILSLSSSILFFNNREQFQCTESIIASFFLLLYFLLLVSPIFSIV